MIRLLEKQMVDGVPVEADTVITTDEMTEALLVAHGKATIEKAPEKKKEPVVEELNTTSKKEIK